MRNEGTSLISQEWQEEEESLKKFYANVFLNDCEREKEVLRSRVSALEKENEKLCERIRRKNKKIRNLQRALRQFGRSQRAMILSWKQTLLCKEKQIIKEAEKWKEKARCFIKSLGE